NFMKTAFKFARPEDIDALWQQITRRDNDAGIAVSKASSTDDTKPSNGLNNAKQSERPSVKSEGGLKTQPSDMATQKSADDDAYEKLDKIYRRFGKIMLLHLKQHRNKMRIKKLRRMAFEAFKQSKHFNEKYHSDDLLEREFQRALKKRRHFTISDDQKKVSISSTET
ncbi:Cell growth-regulating nucleolar protein, partial [Taenia solium]